MPSALSYQALNIFFLGGIFLVAIGLGQLVLCKTSARFFSFGECVVFSAGIGFGILSYSVFLLCSLGILHPEAVYLLLSLCAVLSVFGWLKGRCLAGKVTFTLKEISPGNKGLLLLLSASLLLSFLLVLTPSIGKDALIYHLAVPKLLIKHSGFFFIDGNVFANYPLSSEMLYVMALSLRGEVVAKGVHFVLGLSILMAMWQFGRSHISKTASMPLALVVFYAIPSVFVTSHMAYNDLTVTFYSFLTVYAFINWFVGRQPVWLVLCGVLSGLAISTKYTSLLIPFLGCLGIMWGSRQHEATWQEALRLLSAYLVSVLVVGSPFYVKNWIMTGNPFYPFLYGIFGGKGWDPEQAHLYDMFVRSLGMGRQALDFLLLPWNVSINAKMHSPQFDGVLGPVFLLALPFALGIRKLPVGAKIAMIYCLLSFMFWASSAQQIRYLIPVLPFLAIMTAYIVNYYRTKKAICGVLIVLIAGSMGFSGFHIISDFMNIKPVGVITGMEDKEDFLARKIPSYKMFQYVNAELTEKSKIFLIYMKNYGYLCDHPYYSDSMFESYTLQKILSRSGGPRDVYDSLKKRGINHVLYDINYVSGVMSPFSEKEKDLFMMFQKEYLELIKVEKGGLYLYRII